MVEGQAAGTRRLYGRRQGHRLRQAQRARFERLLPKLRLVLADDGTPVACETLFSKPPDDIWLEIGFGGGEHLIWQAKAHPKIGFLGCEPFVNGLARLLTQVEAEKLQNVRVFPDDARALLAALPPASLGRVFLLFPDPWPKTRHHKRRFVSEENLQALARVMKDGAELRLASDDAGYVEWMLRHLLAAADFAWEAKVSADWHVRPADWPPTRYEAKAVREGREIAYLRFRRRPRRRPGQVEKG